MLSDVKHLHFIGIGGIGMSGLAKIMLERGIKVTGSDLSRGKNVENLIGLGAEVAIGHNANNISGADLVIYSTAIKLGNPEMAAAKKSGIQTLHRARLLGELTRGRRSVAITGAHGKTTTSSMLISILTHAGLDPTFLIGGIDNHFGTNAHTGSGDLIVVEADESDASFLHLFPYFAVCTNIDTEHLDFYSDISAIQKSLGDFFTKVPPQGKIFANLDDPLLVETTDKVQHDQILYFSTQKRCHYWSDIKNSGRPARFTFMENDKSLSKIDLAIGGEHNISNALAAASVASELGCSAVAIQEGLQQHAGVKRRIQHKGDARGVTIYDDYAHHPTEIKAVLKTLKTECNGKLWAIFQPHRYSRFNKLYDEFVQSLELADGVLVMPVYSAHEPPAGSKSTTNFADQLTSQGSHYAVAADSPSACINAIDSKLGAGDVVVTLGAGDVFKVAEGLVEHLGGKR